MITLPLQVLLGVSEEVKMFSPVPMDPQGPEGDHQHQRDDAVYQCSWICSQLFYTQMVRDASP